MFLVKREANHRINRKKKSVIITWKFRSHDINKIHIKLLKRFTYVVI